MTCNLHHFIFVFSFLWFIVLYSWYSEPAKTVHTLAAFNEGSVYMRFVGVPCSRDSLYCWS